MNLRFLVLLTLLAPLAANEPADDFSEFDAPETFDLPAEETKGQTTVAPRTFTTDSEDEFANIVEEEQFDGIVEQEPEVAKKVEIVESGEKKINPLTFADIPSHFRSNWSSYQVEAVMLVVLVLYTLNFLVGKTKNYTLATEWHAHSLPILEQQFALVGDDGVAQEPTGGQLMKDTESSYSIWCSGRMGVQGMLSQLKLVKRQDLVGLVMNYITPKKDRVIHRVDLDVGEMDAFVIAFGLRKSVSRAVKEYTDLSSFTTERKSQYPLVPSNFAIYAEIGETIPAVIDQSVQQFIKKYENVIDYFHFSDQYCGQKTQEDVASRLPETTPTLIFSYNLIDCAEAEELQQVVLQFTFHTIDRLRRYRLSREGKLKAEKKRKSIEEAFLKNTHLQRQEAAQARREEKTRERKQRMLEEEDPEKQRRLQKLEEKKNNKLKMPKMKQLRVK